MFTCKKCDFELETQGLLDAHINNHRSHKPIFSCEPCGQDFQKEGDLKAHVKATHETKKVEVNWNCNDCSFQANIASELMKHLKISAHQPSPTIQEKKKLFSEYKQCYTCKLEFDGYWSLMNHRKIVHPSNKKCRNFPDGKCTFGKDCWYVHEENLMDVDESFKSDTVLEDPQFKCYVCTKDFGDKDTFMKHKKKVHGTNVKNCEKFSKDECSRNNAECWFIHKKTIKENNANIHPQRSPMKQQQGFQKVSEKSPPDHQMNRMMDVLDKLCSKVEIMEKRFQELMN